MKRVPYWFLIVSIALKSAQDVVEAGDAARRRLQRIAGKRASESSFNFGADHGRSGRFESIFHFSTLADGAGARDRFGKERVKRKLYEMTANRKRKPVREWNGPALVFLR